MNRNTTCSTSARDILRQARRRQRLTQAQLAERAGIRQTVVARYESGQQQPTLAALERLVSASGYQLEWNLRNASGANEAVAVAMDLTHSTLGSPFPGPIGRRLMAQLEEVLSLIASRGVTDPTLYGDVADGTEGASSRVLIGVKVAPGLDPLSLVAVAGHLGLLIGAEVQVLPDGRVSAYGYDVGVPLTREEAGPAPRST